jgi:serine/threonine-protein kinase
MNTADPDRLEKVLDQFEKTWRSGTIPRIEQHLPSEAAGLQRRQILEELIKIDLDYRWQQAGQPRQGNGGPLSLRPRLEDYSRVYAALGKPDELSADIVGEEYRVRRRRGDHPSHDEYAGRFPHLRTLLPPVLRKIDAELAAEAKTRPALIPRSMSVDQKETAAPAQPITSSGELGELLGRCRILNAAQLQQLKSDLQPRFPDARALSKELLQRGWLTAYQVNQILSGRGADLLIGQYLVLERLGEGGTGQVFKARHQNMDRTVALKVIRRELLTDSEVVQRFQREVQLISALAHPNVVRAFDAGPIGSAQVLVMEYVEGTDLDKLVKRLGPLPVAQACDCIRQAALALHHIHEHGLVHRDIKPANLFVTGDGWRVAGKDNRATAHAPPATIKILDLGLARLQRSPGGDGNSTSILTPVGAVMIGTPNYLAPEQAIDFHAVDRRADIYSLGCTFYYLLTGQPPFPEGSLAQKLLKHQQEEPPAVEKVRSDVPPQVVAVLRRMLAKRPEDRFPTAGEVAQALQPFCGQVQQPPIEPAPAHSLARGSRAAKLRWVGGVVALMLLGIVVLAFGLARPGLSSLDRRGPSLSFLDRLDAAKIPVDLRAGQPPEIVAVLGVRGPAAPAIDPGSLAISPDSRFLAWVDESNRVHVWDFAGGSLLNSWQGPKERVHLAISPDTKTLAWNNGASEIVLWDLSGNRKRDALKRDMLGGVNVLVFSPDGKTLVSAGKSVYAWDLSQKEKPPTKLNDEKDSNARCLACSPAGNLLAAGSAALIVYDLSAQKKKLSWKHPSGNLSAVAYSSDGRFVVGASHQSPLIVTWDMAGEQRYSFKEGNDTRPLSLASAADGKLAAAAKDAPKAEGSAAAAGHVSVWEDCTGREKPLKKWTLPVPVTAVAWASDSRHLAVLNTDGTVSILRLAEARTAQK